MLKDRLSQVPVGKNNGKYFEDFCVEEIIRAKLSNFFGYISDQNYTTDRHRRYDCCVALKSPWDSGSKEDQPLPPSASSAYDGLEEPWDIFQLDFNTRIVIFEFKNYSKKIDRNEVLLTSKYLSRSAKRNVAIMITRSGYKKAAQEESISILREHGKLILLINIDDLVNAIDNDESISVVILSSYHKILIAANQ